MEGAILIDSEWSLCTQNILIEEKENLAVLCRLSRSDLLQSFSIVARKYYITIYAQLIQTYALQDT
jgi:hypothetical protein